MRRSPPRRRCRLRGRGDRGMERQDWTLSGLGPQFGVRSFSARVAAAAWAPGPRQGIMRPANKEKVMQTPRFLRWATLATLAFLTAGPLAAYTIYLKDGSTVQSKGKYRVQNGKAYITLPNGTQTFIDAKEIDVKRTDEANKADYGGNAVIPQEATPPPGAPPPRPCTTARGIDAKRTDEANKAADGGNGVTPQGATPPADGTPPVPQSRRL